jgi:transcriptional regulator with XRE-family HTH domain
MTNPSLVAVETAQPIEPTPRVRERRDWRKDIAAALRTYRIASFLTQYELCNRLRCNRTTVKELELKGPLYGRLAFVEKLADGLGIPLHWLFEAPTAERVGTLFAARMLIEVRLAQIDKEEVLQLVSRMVVQKSLRKVV